MFEDFGVEYGNVYDREECDEVIDDGLEEELVFLDVVELLGKVFGVVGLYVEEGLVYVD